MIIDRVIAINVVEPKLVMTRVPVGRVSHDVETVRTVASGERRVPGASGAILDVFTEEIEIDLYTPQDVLVFADRAQLRPA